MARLLTEEELKEREKMADRAERQREAELQMARAGHYAPGMSMRDINALENEVKREKLIATKGNEEQWRYRTLGRMMSQSERRKAEMLAMGVSDRERFVADNAFRNRELRTREREAEYKALGMKIQGAAAAEHNATATEYKASKDAEVAKYNADRQKEIEAARNASNEKVAGINADAQVDVQTEKNKGTGIAGEWAVKTEQERAKTEAAKAAAQERVYQNRYGERSATTDNAKIANIATQLSRNKKYRKYTPEQLRELAERMYRQGQSGE